MSAKRYTQGTEVLNLVELLDSNKAYAETHKSHLYPYRANALLEEVPAIDEIADDSIFQQKLKIIHDTIVIGGRMARSHQTLILDEYVKRSTEAWELDESSKRLLQALDNTANSIQKWYIILAMWINDKIEDENKHIQWDWFEWEFMAPDYISEHYPSIDLEEFGFKTIAWTSDDPDELFAQPLEWELDEPGLLEENFEAHDEDADLAITWLTEHMKELNLLYKTSVHLINFSAFTRWQTWLETESAISMPSYSDEDAEQTHWIRNKKTDENNFFPKSFEARFFGESETSKHGFSVKMPNGTTYNNNLHTVGIVLAKARVNVESVVPYYEYIKAYKGDKKWDEWWKKRNEWFEAYKILSAWFNNQTQPPTTEAAVEAYDVLDSHSLEINISIEKLEEIKRKQLIKQMLSWSNPEGKSQAEALETFNRFEQTYGEMFDKLGYRLQLIKKEDDDRNRRAHNFINKAFSGLDETERNVLSLRYGLAIGNDHNKFIKSLSDRLKELSDKSSSIQDEKFLKAASVHALVNENMKNLKFQTWLEVLSDQEGRCSRQIIGYQKVRSDSDKKVSESTYRNAGMRFVEKHGIEPVSQYVEIKLVDALVTEFRKQCKISVDYNEERTRQLCNFIKRSGDSDGLIENFAEACVKMEIDENTAILVLERAYPSVGKKKANNKTLYNASHVAVAFIEEGMDPKPPQAPKGVVAEVIKP